MTTHALIFLTVPLKLTIDICTESDSTYFVARIFHLIWQNGWIVTIILHPRLTWTASVQKDVLASRVAMVVAEDKRRLVETGEKLKQALCVEDGRMTSGTRTEPTPVQVLSNQRTTMAIKTTHRATAN